MVTDACKRGDHPWKDICGTDSGKDGSKDHVRWCPDCGAVVGDIEKNGTVYHGAIFKPMVPTAHGDIFL